MNTPDGTSTSNDTGPRRRWFQFRLRTLLIALIAVSIPLGWYLNRVRIQQQAVAEIRAAGGSVIYDWQVSDSYPTYPAWINAMTREPPWPRWLTSTLGDDYFYDAVEVHFMGREPGGVGYGDFQTDDAALARLHEPLGRLSNLKSVHLNTYHVTHEGLEQLEKALPNCNIIRVVRPDHSNS